MNEPLSLLLGRIERTRQQVGERFPLYADPGTGTWTTTRRGSWTGGFWAGLLAMHAVWTGNSPRHAFEVRRRLDGWTDADTVCRGFIFWYGDTAHRLGITESNGSALQAANALCVAFDVELGAIPWGSAFGRPARILRADGAAGVVPLLGWASRQPGANADMKRIALRHLRTHLGLPRATRTRDNAWILLAVVDGAAWLGEDFPEIARKLARSWLARHRSTIPPALETTGGVQDSSAAAIVAVALLKLTELTGEPDWRQHGEQILRSLLDHAVIPTGPARGGLGIGCYDAELDTATKHELIWGDYFLAVALALRDAPAPGIRESFLYL